MLRCAQHDTFRAPGRLSPAPRWSAHWCDIYEAVRQGLKIDLELLHAGCEDESAWQQEYGCQFVSTAENFFPPDLLAASLSAEASADDLSLLLASAPRLGKTGSGGQVSGAREEQTGFTPDTRHPTPDTSFYLGIDIGRHRDRTVFWLDEVQVSGSGFQVPGEKAETRHLAPGTTRLSIARLVRTLANTPFDDQLAFARELLSLTSSDGQPLVRRAAIDATGMGAPLAESLAREFGPRVEPVVFTPAVKEDLAFRTKRRLESRLSLLPDTQEIRRAFSAVKKFVTPSGNLRFDAVRTEAGHADEFWAKALADLAADSRPLAHAADAFLVDGAPLIHPAAFAVDGTWEGLGWT